jgi:hypothetical protein
MGAAMTVISVYSLVRNYRLDVALEEGSRVCDFVSRVSPSSPNNSNIEAK